MHSLDHVRKEPESEVQTEQLQVEETNTEFDQGKPRQAAQHVNYWERHRQCLWHWSCTLGYNIELSHLYVMFFLFLYRLSVNMNNTYETIILLIFNNIMI
jgi:hypothetical protein